MTAIPHSLMLFRTQVNIHTQIKLRRSGSRTANMTLLNYSDGECESKPFVSAANGIVLSQNGTVALIEVNKTQSEVTVIVSDCVGWLNSQTIQFVRKNSIIQPTMSNAKGIHTSGGVQFIGYNGSFMLSSPDILQITLDCYASVGTVICNEVGHNMWDLEFDEVLSSMNLTFNLVDQIGNTQTMTYRFTSDVTTPWCNYGGVRSGNTLYLRNLSSLDIVCFDGQTSVREIIASSSDEPNNNQFLSDGEFYFLPVIPRDKCLRPCRESISGRFAIGARQFPTRPYMLFSNHRADC